MHSRRSMAHELHDGVLGDAGTVAAGNEADARAVEAQMPQAEALEETPPLLARHLRHFESPLPALCFETDEKRPKFRGEGSGEIFVPFRVEADRVALQVHFVQGKTRFAKTASLVPCDLVGNSHPLGLAGQRIANLLVLFVGYLRLFFRALLLDSQSAANVREAIFRLNRFMQQNAEELDFVQGGIEAGLEDGTLLVPALAPLDELPDLLAGELPGRENAVLREKGGDIAPAIEVAPVCLGRRLVPLLHEFGNPRVPQFLVAVGAFTFALLHLRAKLSRSLRLGRQIGAELGRFADSFSGGVSKLHPPKRGFLLSVEKGHTGMRRYNVSNLQPQAFSGK